MIMRFWNTCVDVMFSGLQQLLQLGYLIMLQNTSKVDLRNVIGDGIFQILNYLRNLELGRNTLLIQYRF